MEKERLTYQRVNNSDNVIAIDLHNGFSVVAITGWQPDSQEYVTSLYITDDFMNELSVIDEAGYVSFRATRKQINSAILRYVSKCNEEGMFDFYIRRYQLMDACVNSYYTLKEIDQGAK